MVLYQMSCANFFSPPVSCVSLHSLDFVFHRAEVFNFNEAQFISYFFYESCPCSLESLLCPRSSRFSLMLPLRSCKILHFVMQNGSMIHFELIFVKGVRSVSGFLFSLAPF